MLIAHKLHSIFHIELSKQLPWVILLIVRHHILTQILSCAQFPIIQFFNHQVRHVMAHACRTWLFGLLFWVSHTAYIFGTERYTCKASLSLSKFCNGEEQIIFRLLLDRLHWGPVWVWGPVEIIQLQWSGQLQQGRWVVFNIWQSRAGEKEEGGKLQHVCCGR